MFINLIYRVKHAITAVDCLLYMDEHAIQTVDLFLLSVQTEYTLGYAGFMVVYSAWLGVINLFKNLNEQNKCV